MTLALERLKIDPEVLDYLEAERVGDTDDERTDLLEDWVTLAAICTHEEGNLRYGAFIMRYDYDDHAVTNVWLDSPLNDWCRMCFDTKMVLVDDIEEGSKMIQCQQCKGVENEGQDAIQTGPTTDRYSGWPL